MDCKSIDSVANLEGELISVLENDILISCE